MFAFEGSGFMTPLFCYELRFYPLLALLCSHLTHRHANWRAKQEKVLEEKEIRFVQAVYTKKEAMTPEGCPIANEVSWRHGCTD